MSKNKQPSVITEISGQEPSNVEKALKPKVHNNLVKEYFKKDEIFSDFVNGASGGSLDVRTEMLSPSDTTLVVSDLSIQDGVRTIVTKELFRDIAKKVTDSDGSQYNLCIEDQTYFAKNMGVRVLLYDALGLSSLKDSKIIPTATMVCNWDRKRFPSPFPISSLYSAPYHGFVKNHMVDSNVFTFNVVDYIHNRDIFPFKTELGTVMTFISGALNDMGMEEIEKRCPEIKDKRVSKLAFMIINLYVKLDINYNELDEEENNMVSIYQEAINRAAAEAAEKAAAEAAAKAAAEATNKTREESVFENALILSKKYNRSFSDLLDDLEVSPSFKEKLMERYEKMVG